MDFTTHQIGGLTLEKYAKLCALMANTKPEETDKHAEIAASNGVSTADWETAKKGWTDMMMNPQHAMAVQQVFMPAYQKAITEGMGNSEPCTLELYAELKAAMAFEKHPENANEKIPFEKVLERGGFTHSQWNTIETYWVPRVTKDMHGRLDQSLFNEEASQKFSALLQQHSDKINGIVR